MESQLLPAMLKQSLEQINLTGFAIVRDAINGDRLRELCDACQRIFVDPALSQSAKSKSGHVYAARNLIHSIPLVQTIGFDGELGHLLTGVLGEAYGLVRVLYFDKPPDRTWSLAWHRDQAIAVRQHLADSGHLSRPTVKAGVPHMVASDAILSQMLTLRLHLDAADEENGALKVIPESHFSSVSPGKGIENYELIRANPGDVLAMRPLIIHSSGSSHPETKRHRRIIHLEFAATNELPDGFEWQHYIGRPGLREIDFRQT
ncbi:MAG: phytanoyl-CoA dioxygenase family protein [Pirellulaceae bacterium]